MIIIIDIFQVYGIPNVYKVKINSHPVKHHEETYNKTIILKKHDKVRVYFCVLILITIYF